MLAAVPSASVVDLWSDTPCPTKPVLGSSFIDCNCFTLEVLSLFLGAENLCEEVTIDVTSVSSFINLVGGGSEMRLVAVEACVSNLNDRSRFSSDSVACLKSLFLIFLFLSLFLPFTVLLAICVVDTDVKNASVFVVVVGNCDTGVIGKEIVDIDVATVDDDVMGVFI